MLRAILNKSWRQQHTRHQLYGHLPPITKTIQVRQNKHAGHCWRSRDELISDVFLWTPTYGREKAERPARTYIQQLCENTGCSPENLPEAINDREKWWERVRKIRASATTWWWWWWWCMFIWAAFKSYMKWSNAQRNSTPTTMILINTAGSFFTSSTVSITLYTRRKQTYRTKYCKTFDSSTYH